MSTSSVLNASCVKVDLAFLNYFSLCCVLISSSAVTDALAQSSKNLTRMTSKMTLIAAYMSTTFGERTVAALLAAARTLASF